MGVVTHVIVVAYGHADELDGCLAALAKDFSVTVVDNSSSPEVRDVGERHGARVVDPGANLGFAAGVNIGLRELEGIPPEFVLLLNPDARVLPSDLRALMCALGDLGPDVAAVAPRLVGADGVDQRVVWPFPSPLRAWLQAVGLGRVRSSKTFVIGAVLLLRWAAVREVGLFDERFFLYAEETDWFMRAHLLGWQSSVCADVVVEHRGAGSSEDNDRREVLFHAGQETYVRKWYGRAGWFAYRLGVTTGAVARALFLRGPRRAEAARRAGLYARGPRRVARFDAS